MNIHDIQQQTQALIEHYTTMQTSSFQDEIDRAYSLRILNTCAAVLNQPDEHDEALASSLQKVLADNWALIKGSAFSYTALPKHNVTLLLCDIAQGVATE